MVRDLMDDWLEFIEGNTEDSFLINRDFLLATKSQPAFWLANTNIDLKLA